MKKKRLFKILIIISMLFMINTISYGANYLVNINGKNYTKKQFEIWWKYWKNKKTPFPSTPQPFIDWILLSDEAKAMGLDKEPSYQKKLKIFREVRSLLQLRYEEVENKIKITPESLYKFYEKNYVPFYRIKAIVSDNLTEILKIKNKIKNQDDFLKQFEILKKERKTKDLGWQRPINIPEQFKSLVLKSKKRDILPPVKYKGYYFILLVEDKFGATKKDYQKIHKNLAFKYKKSEEAKFTSQLLKKLRKKYKISINWQSIYKIKPFDNLSEDLSKKVVLKIDKNDLTGATFQNMLKRDIELRVRDKKISNKKLKKFQESLVQNTINQTLTTLEGLNRHYEKTVMKDIYWFYKRNRLIKELEAKIINPAVKVSSKEVKKYYETNGKKFVKPEMVEIAVIQTKDKKLIKNALKRIKRGEDFFEVARDIQFHGALPEKRRLDSIVENVRKVIKQMRPGTISNIIKYKDWFFIVKLIKKHEKKYHSFNEVKKSIRKLIYNKKLQKARENYLKKLREKSKIEINKTLWEEILKTYKPENSTRRN